MMATTSTVTGSQTLVYTPCLFAVVVIVVNKQVTRRNFKAGLGIKEQKGRGTRKKLKSGEIHVVAYTYRYASGHFYFLIQAWLYMVPTKQRHTGTQLILENTPVFL